MHHPAARALALLDYWFGPLDDTTPLDRTRAPFQAQFNRWYGKDPALDDEIRRLFRADLDRVAAAPAGWAAEVDAWGRAPDGLVALVILLDQLPRNMFRGTAGMYRYDTLAMSVATQALRAPGFDALPLVRRMFVSMPLMHAECVTTQREVVRHFEALVAAAEQRSPVNVGFYRFALDYAHRHRDVVERYGRFPHRNELLGRRSTPEEEAYLAEPGAGF